MENTVEQDQEHEVYGGDIPEMDTDFEMSRDDETTVGCTPEIDCLDWFSDPEDLEDMNKRLKEIEEDAGALCEMQAKVEKEMGSAQDFKENQELKKTDGKGEWKLNISELKDAYFTDTAYSEDCTLILTQGNSTKAVAMRGLSVLGQDYHGVFPLKGKLFNVRKASNEKLQKNAEFQNIKKILGLKGHNIYENAKELRYGHLMIMADQDHEGSRFKGLLINFLHLFWPSLLKVPNFMLDFIPPIVEASTKENTIEKLAFYSMADYEAWKKDLGDKATDYEIKYRKGLASIKTKEVEEYFANLDNCTKKFIWADDEDGDAIELAFDKMKIVERNDWLQAHQAGDSKEKHIRYRDFIKKELFVFSNQISIPSVVDGLNLGQRKILFCAFKKPIIEAIQVSEFSFYVSVHSAYHHRNARLVDTILGMAHSYVGCNNINLLQLPGQFGTRLLGGKDHLSARCILTQLSPITRYIFHKADERLLNYLNDSGQSIEPAWFIPIIPMVLVNRSVGTRWSSSILNYNPRDIIANLIRLLNGEAMIPMIPWSRCLEGKIQKSRYTANMHLFDEDGVIKKYDTPEQILKEFFDIRLRFYEKRRTAQLCELKKDKLLLENKARFIELVCNKEIDVIEREFHEFFQELESKNFEPLPETGYHYLISIGLESLTYAKALELRRELVAKEEINLLTNTTPEYLWDKDLDALAQQLDEQDKEDIIKREQAERRNARIAKEAPKKKAPTKRTAASPLPQRANKKRLER